MLLRAISRLLIAAPAEGENRLTRSHSASHHEPSRGGVAIGGIATLEADVLEMAHLRTTPRSAAIEYGHADVLAGQP